MRALLLLAVLLIAGCAEAPAPSAPDDVDAQPAARDGSLPLIAAEDFEPLTGLGEFHWSTVEDLSDMAFELQVDFGASNACDVNSAVTGSTDELGTRSIFMADSGWSAGGSVPAVRVRAGPMDTEDVLGGSGGAYGSAGGFGGTWDGLVTLTRVGRNVHVESLDAFNSGQSLSFSIVCEGPFDVVGARIGFEAVVGDTQNLDGTMASQNLLGEAATGSQSLDVTAEEGHVVFGSFGNQLGEVTLRSPDDTVTRVLPSERSAALVGGPGTYEVTLQRAAGGFEAYWHTMYGLSDFVDLSPGIRDEPAYVSPV